MAQFVTHHREYSVTFVAPTHPSPPAIHHRFAILYCVSLLDNDKDGAPFAGPLCRKLCPDKIANTDCANLLTMSIPFHDGTDH